MTKSEQVVVRSRTMLPQLAAKARVACAIVAELQESLLILDEVDLILHPLKSELNWPLGQKHALDFTRGVSSTDNGLRWEVRLDPNKPRTIA